MVSTSTLLPQINSPEHYRELFKNNLIWEPAIKSICETHQIYYGGSQSLRRSESGSHIVYKAGPYWIKLMAPVYQKEMLYELAGLKSVTGRLSVKTPEVIGEGWLEGWPFVILTDVPGEAIKSVWPKLNRQDQATVIKTMAMTIKEIAACPTDDLVKKRFAWNEFISEQYRKCETLQIQKPMPDAWLKNLKEFINEFSIQEFETSKPQFLHSDLSYDHFLIDSKSRLLLSGIIDLADCQWGHPEYELAAPCVFIFKNDREALRLFLKEWGIDHPNHRLSKKLLAWCLLHRYFSNFSTFLKAEMDQCRPGSFSDLANLVFPL